MAKRKRFFWSVHKWWGLFCWFRVAVTSVSMTYVQSWLRKFIKSIFSAAIVKAVNVSDGGCSDIMALFRTAVSIHTERMTWADAYQHHFERIFANFSRAWQCVLTLLASSFFHAVVCVLYLFIRDNQFIGCCMDKIRTSQANTLLKQLMDLHACMKQIEKIKCCKADEVALIFWKKKRFKRKVKIDKVFESISWTIDISFARFFLRLLLAK